MNKRTLYDVLESGRQATQYAIQCAYERLSAKYNTDHPNNQNNEEARIKSYAVKEAFLILGNPEKRSQYDRQLERLAGSVKQDFKGIDPFWTARKVMTLMAIMIVGGGFYFYEQRERVLDYQSDPALMHDSSDAFAGGDTGFISVPLPLEAQKPGRVVVFAPENCPLEAGRRSDELERQLKSRNIPYIRTARADYYFSPPPDSASMAKLSSIMRGEVPIVFINGKGKSNPSLGEVLAEYQTSSR